MPSRANAFLRHQQTRWLRPDAARWLRPDVAKFLTPGSDVADVYPALAQRRDRDIAEALAHERSVLAALRAELDVVAAELARRKAERKYNADQPRVPAGNSDGGQWTSGAGGSGRPRVYITTSPDSDGGFGDGGLGDGGGLGIDVGNVIGDVFGEVAREIEKIDLFDIKPKKPRTGGVRLAGKPPRRLPRTVGKPGESREPGTPGIGHNQGPPLDPPEIPKRLPDTTEGRMGFVRRAAGWIARVGRRAPAVDVFLGALDQANDLKRLTDMIKTANDPPETLDVLQDRATRQSEDGYNDHHIINQHNSNRKKFGNERIDSRENLVRTPTLVHIEISRWYSTKNEKIRKPTTAGSLAR